MEELKQFVETHNLPGKMVFAKVWGSRSHNTHKQDSDWDFSGVYVANTREYLGMTPPAETIQNKEGAEKPDYSFHEAGKFCNLLLVGNPGILEMLFTERMMFVTPEWDVLKKERRKFLSRKSVYQYVGYAEGQLKRLKAGAGLHTKGCGYNEKWAYHLMRLLMDAQRIVCGQEPTVWKEDGGERNYLMRIRNGEVCQSDVEKDAQYRIDDINTTLETNMSNLPEMGDKDVLQEWLIDLRLKQL